MIRRPPRSTLFPPTPLFRSRRAAFRHRPDAVERLRPFSYPRYPQRNPPPVPSNTIFSSRHTAATRSEEHTSELQSRSDLVCRLLLEKKKKHQKPLLISKTSH